jgi:kinesin family protein 13
VTEDFVEYVREDALSIEIWGHQSTGEGECPAAAKCGENSSKKRQTCAVESGQQATTTTPSASQSNGSLASEVALKKQRSLLERWSEVTKRLALWVEIHELNDQGEYGPVEVDADPKVPTGGVYQLRQVCECCSF